MKLILAPHVDDEVIGCGGILDKECIVAYFGVDEFHVVTAIERMEEANAVSIQTHHLYRPPSATYKVNRYQENFVHLISDIEDLVNTHIPDEVYLPWPSYNQDHQAIYNAAMIATRPHDHNHFVKRVLLYEEPDCFWPGMSAAFKPNYYKKIDIDNKLYLYELMRSQVREHRSMMAIKALAAVRGAAIMEDYAEAFHILRWID